MLNLRGMERVCIVGSGTAGWFAALELRKLLSPSVEILVISDPATPIIGVGEGGILNFIEKLIKLEIPLLEFMQETQAVHKLGFAYQGWRTGAHDDIFYHMFPMSVHDNLQQHKGFFPEFSILLNHDIPISNYVDSVKLREENISQENITKMMMSDAPKNFGSSFHFDTFKVGEYLKKIALFRGVKLLEAKVENLLQDSEQGFIEYICVKDKKIKTNFVIDATGFSRLIIDKQLKAKWHSFKKYLPMNTAIPFHLKHPKNNPDLVTLATAMNAGWVWNIPLQHRVGAGYVFDDNFINVEEAMAEVEKNLGHDIEINKIIKFDAGFYEDIWVNNVLAIGLASGFVEPLEATSIAQTLAQLELFTQIIEDNNGIIPRSNVKFYNEQNKKAWLGIRDFIRMHYDTGRQDTPFWRHMLTAPVSLEYEELKECWKYRTPRSFDFINHEMDEFTHFNTYSWLAIGQALKIIDAQASVTELVALPEDKKIKLLGFLKKYKS